MKVLIGTDILLMFLKKQELMDGISLMFKWLKLSKSSWYIDISSIVVLTHFVTTDELGELKGFHILKEVRPLTSTFKRLLNLLTEAKVRTGSNQRTLLAQLNYLKFDDVDYLVTENLLTHQLAQQLNLDERVFTIEEFIEKCSVDYSELDDSKGVVIKKVKFGTLDYNNPFFNTFRDEYEPYYHVWFQKKAQDDVYVASDKKGRLRGLLKLKIEDSDDDGGCIVPPLRRVKRLKISSLKADYTGQKLGERFMRIVFETALKEHVEDIYITLFPTSPQRKRLVGVIRQWGFTYHGKKDGDERVYVRHFERRVLADAKSCFPFHSTRNGVFIIPIYRGYAMQLLPTFGLDADNNEIDNSKQAIKKVLILHESHNHLHEGSILLFMQKSHSDDKQELIAVGVVEKLHRNFRKEEDFLNRCQKRSTLTRDVLHQCWHRAEEKPVVVEFLYAYHFENPVPASSVEFYHVREHLRSQCPIEMSRNYFFELFKGTKYEESLVVD